MRQHTPTLPFTQISINKRLAKHTSLVRYNFPWGTIYYQTYTQFQNLKKSFRTLEI